MTTTIMTDPTAAVAQGAESTGDRAAQRQHRLHKPQGKTWGEWAAEVLDRVDADLSLLLPNARHTALITFVTERMEAARAAALKGQFQAAAQSAWSTRMDTLEEVFSIEMTETSEAIDPFRGKAEEFSPQIEQAVAQVTRLLTDACLEASNGRLKAVRLVRQAADIAGYLRMSPMGRSFLGYSETSAPSRKEFRGGGNRSNAAARGRTPVPTSPVRKDKENGTSKRAKHGLKAVVFSGEPARVG